jgi:hypothetical protein
MPADAGAGVARARAITAVEASKPLTLMDCLLEVFSVISETFDNQ